MNAGAMPLRASTAVRAFAKVAIIMPKYPDRMEVMPPRMNATVLNTPLRSSISLVRSPSGVTIESSEKIATAMMTMNTPM